MTALSDIMTRLQQVLEDEARLLRSANGLEALSLAPDKQALVEALEAGLAALGPTAAPAPLERQFQAVRRLAHDNSVLLKALRHGVSALFERPLEASLTGAYGPTGTRQAFTRAAGGYSQRI